VKEFRRPRERYTTVKQYLLAPRRGRGHHLLRALDDVSFEIAKGEFLGIVGRNGSGKSTLLKCLAGIYRPDQGELRVEGRIAPFIELGIGFDEDMAARDNVIVNAVLLGIRPAEARRRFDDIVAFAELQDFVDLKLKNYSSGMTARLAFAVTVHVDADVLLLDEVLAVGDAAFQQKCYAHFEHLRASGRTVILVTHDKSLVERFCDRALLLDKGQVLEIGTPQAVLRRYSELIARHTRRLGTHSESEAAPARIDGWFEDEHGTSVRSCRQGEECTVCVLVQPDVAVEMPVLTVTFENADGQAVFATSTRGHDSGSRLEAGLDALIRIRFANFLAPGRYTALATLGDGIDLPGAEPVAQLLVLGERPSGGLVDLPYDVEVERP
jgi:ABC-type polysaccharide/polyol phosphate transport system ATPase subunit